MTVFAFFYLRLISQVSSVEIDQLNSADYSARSKAHSLLALELREKGMKSIPSLMNIYKTSRDPEVKIRIEGLIKDVVLRQRYGLGPGYVGIRMGDDKVVNEGKMMSAVKVLEVVDGSPANLAQLKVGDFILGVDELVFTEDRVGNITPSLSFSNYIKTKAVQEVVEIRIFREGKEMVVKVSLALMPEELQREQQQLGLRRNEPSVEEKNKYFDGWLQSQLGEK